MGTSLVDRGAYRYKATRDAWINACKGCHSPRFASEINMAAERIVRLKESGIECHVDPHLIHIKMDTSKKKPGKVKYGGFPWEIKSNHLKNFPVIFDYDENYQFLGLTILR